MQYPIKAVPLCCFIMPSSLPQLPIQQRVRPERVLDVNAMVQAEQMENSECILCMTCVDNAQKTSSAMFSAPGSKNNKEDLPS